MIPPLRDPARQKARKGKSRVAPVGMTEREKRRLAGSPRARFIVPLHKSDKPDQRRFLRLGFGAEWLERARRFLEAQFGLVDWRLRPMPRASAGTFFGDYGAGGDVGAVAEPDWSDEDGIAADEDAIADGGWMFGEAVVIAGDGAGADVGFVADFGVADIGKMRGLGALADGALFNFHEIADARAFEEMGFGPEAGEGTNDDFGFEPTLREDAVGFDEDIVPERGVVKDAAGADAATGADFGFAEELDAGFEDGVFADSDIRIDENGFGKLDGDTVAHELRALPLAEGAIHTGEIGAGIAAQGFTRIRGDFGEDGFPFGIEDRDGIREIDLAVLVLWFHLREARARVSKW